MSVRVSRLNRSKAGAQSVHDNDSTRRNVVSRTGSQNEDDIKNNISSRLDRSISLMRRKRVDSPAGRSRSGGGGSTTDRSRNRDRDTGRRTGNRSDSGSGGSSDDSGRGSGGSGRGSGSVDDNNREPEVYQPPEPIIDPVDWDEPTDPIQPREPVSTDDSGFNSPWMPVGGSEFDSTSENYDPEASRRKNEEIQRITRRDSSRSSSGSGRGSGSGSGSGSGRGSGRTNDNDTGRRTGNRSGDNSGSGGGQNSGFSDDNDQPERRSRDNVRGDYRRTRITDNEGNRRVRSNGLTGRNRDSGDSQTGGIGSLSDLANILASGQAGSPSTGGSDGNGSQTAQPVQAGFMSDTYSWLAFVLLGGVFYLIYQNS